MAALQLNNCGYRFSFYINWTGDSFQDVYEGITLLRDQKTQQKLAAHCLYKLPSRLWVKVIQRSGLDPQSSYADLSNKKIEALSQAMTSMKFEAVGKTTYKEEFVTAGGVSLSEINHKSMSHKKIKGLFFTGEVLDVDGVTGGFNFQNAWTTGFIAGKHLGLDSEFI